MTVGTGRAWSLDEFRPSRFVIIGIDLQRALFLRQSRTLASRAILVRCEGNPEGRACKHDPTLHE
jgi:hypothetical protein